MYSKMNVTDELKHYGAWTTLTVTDMLEALARVSEMVSMPTLEDMASVGASNAYEYFARIDKDVAGAYRTNASASDWC